MSKVAQALVAGILSGILFRQNNLFYVACSLSNVSVNSAGRPAVRSSGSNQAIDLQLPMILPQANEPCCHFAGFVFLTNCFASRYCFESGTKLIDIQQSQRLE